MKRFMFTIFVGVLFVCAPGCGGSNKPKTSSSTNPSSQTGVSPETAEHDERQPLPKGLSAKQQTKSKPVDDPKAVAALQDLGAKVEFDDGGIVERVVFPHGATDEHTTHLSQLANVRGLEMPEARLSEEGWKRIIALTALRSLGLAGVTVGGVDMSHLKRLSKLEKLDLSWSKVRNADLKHVQQLSALIDLDLSMTDISDGAVTTLMSLTNLKRLVLEGSAISEERIAELGKVLPKLDLDSAAIEAKETPPPVQGPPTIGVAAPEIVGKDVQGVEFRLSDYRGKVVMLDFWGHW